MASVVVRDRRCGLEFAVETVLAVAMAAAFVSPRNDEFHLRWIHRHYSCGGYTIVKYTFLTHTANLVD